jgi:hypothetical protein
MQVEEYDFILIDQFIKYLLLRCELHACQSAVVSKGSSGGSGGMQVENRKSGLTQSLLLCIHYRMRNWD